MISNDTAAEQIIALLVAQGVVLDDEAAAEAALGVILNNWNGALSNANIALAISDFAALVNARDQDISDWATGSATGGPLNDGVFPIRITGGATVNVKSPARLELEARGFRPKPGVAHVVDLPVSDNEIGDTRRVSADNHIYVWTVALEWEDYGLAGAPGDTGPATEWRSSGGNLQYRAAGSSDAWTTVVALSAITGPAGADGTDGVDGTDGTDGADGNSPGVLQIFSTTTADADPGAGTIRLNNATMSSVTQAMMDLLEKGAASIGAYIDAATASNNTSSRGTMKITQVGDPTKFAIFGVTGGATSPTGYKKVPLSYLAGPGGFTNGATVSIEFSRAGDKGTDGAGAGDVLGPATNSDNYLAQWNGADSKTLKNGRAIGVASTTDVPDRQSADTRYPLIASGTHTGTTDIQQAVNLGGDLTPSQITADTNNYNPANLATATALRLSTDASRNLTGIAGGAGTRVLIIENVGSNDLVLVHESSSSTAANRLGLGGSNITLTAGKSLVLRYDATSSRWRAIGSAAGVGSSGVGWNDVAFTGTGASQTVTLPESGLTGQDILVTVNGVVERDFTVVGTTLTITTPSAGDNGVVMKRQGATGPAGPALAPGSLAISDITGLQAALDAKAYVGKYKSVDFVTTNLVLAKADVGCLKVMNVVGGNTVTFPPASSVSWAVGEVIDGVQGNTGATTLTAGSGVTLVSLSGYLKTAGLGASWTAIYVAADTWLVIGALVA